MKEAEVNGPIHLPLFCRALRHRRAGQNGSLRHRLPENRPGLQQNPRPKTNSKNCSARSAARPWTRPRAKTSKQAYLQTRFVEPLRYQSMVTLLQSFAEQLSEHAESLAIIEEGSEPAAIAKARKYIHANLDQPLPLGLVARQAGLSESHFCRLFKDSAGLTLTDYVNRCRIDWAKRELLKPEARISEIAFPHRLPVTLPVQPEFRPHRRAVPHPLSAGPARARRLLMRLVFVIAARCYFPHTEARRNHGRSLRNPGENRPRWPWRGLPGL